MDITHVISFINEYHKLDEKSLKTHMHDFDGQKLIQLKYKVLVRTFFNELSKRNEMDFVDQFVQLYNEVWTPEYDEQYEKDKESISNMQR